LPKDQDDDSLDGGDVTVPGLGRLGDLGLEELFDKRVGGRVEEPGCGEHYGEEEGWLFFPYEGEGMDCIAGRGSASFPC
jgi:hypothetical protein